MGFLFAVGFQFALLEIQDRPVSRLGVARKNLVGVHGNRVTHASKHVEVVVAVGVSVGTSQADVALLGHLLNGNSLTFAVQRASLEFSS